MGVSRRLGAARATLALGLAAALVGGGVAFATGTAAPGAVHAAPSNRLGTARFVPAGFQRLIDTRSTRASVPEGGVVRVAAPPGALAVVLNLTVDQATAPGFWTAWPTGRARPTASNLNVDRAGQTIANMATVPVGADGSISVFGERGGHLIVDLLGTYVASGATSSGRIQLVAATRLLDTRGATPIAARGAVVVRVPDTTATAAIVNLTVPNARAAGFWSAGSAGRPWPPTTSSLNIDRVGDTRANQVIVPLVNGRFEVVSESGGDLIVDLMGTITGEGARSSTDGLVTPLIEPVRLGDTRQTEPLGPGWHVPITQQIDGVGGLIGNLTGTNAPEAGYISLVPGSGTSVLNLTPTQTVANHVSIAFDNEGFALFSDRGADLVVDVSAYIVGTPRMARQPLPPNVRISDVQAMLQQLAAEAAARDTSMAVSARWQGQQTSVRGTEPRSSLSSAKLWWTAAALTRHSADDLWPIAEQIFTISDDCAGGQMLTEAGGADALNAQLRAWGIPSRTHLSRWFNCGPHVSSEFSGNNVFSTDDAISFLVKLRNGELLPPEKTATLLSWLRIPSDRLGGECELCGMLTNLLPDPVATAAMHKTGWTDEGDKHTHIGIIPYTNGDLTVAVATTGSVAGDSWAIGQLGCRLHRLVADPTYRCE
jgi:Beta-lactamase enzyme family